jgi:hypothetical protein
MTKANCKKDGLQRRSANPAFCVPIAHFSQFPDSIVATPAGRRSLAAVAGRYNSDFSNQDAIRF